MTVTTRRARSARLLSLVALAGVLAACGGGKPSGSPASPHVVSATLNDLSCVDDASCVAVGSYLPVDTDETNGDPDGDGSATRALIEGLVDNKWRTLASPPLERGGGVLSGVSCPTSTSCVTVGYDQAPTGSDDSELPQPHTPVAFSGGKSRWHPMTLPAVATNSVLSGVACTSPGRCVAVGYSATRPANDRFVETPLALSLTDGHWTAMPLVTPAGSSIGLNSIACTTTDACVAVGSTASANQPTATRPYVEMLGTAGRWQAATLPQAAEGAGTLYSVTCPAPAQCLAAGTAATGHSAGSGLVLRQAGDGWSVDEAALAVPGQNTISALDCTSTSRCLIAGLSAASLTGRPTLFLAVLSSSGWQQLANATGLAYVDQLRCPDDNRCLLVGSDGATTYNAAYTVTGLQQMNAPTP